MSKLALGCVGDRGGGPAPGHQLPSAPRSPRCRSIRPSALAAAVSHHPTLPHFCQPPGSPGRRRQSPPGSWCPCRARPGQCRGTAPPGAPAPAGAHGGQGRAGRVTTVCPRPGAAAMPAGLLCCLPAHHAHRPRLHGRVQAQPACPIAKHASPASRTAAATALPPPPHPPRAAHLALVGVQAHIVGDEANLLDGLAHHRLVVHLGAGGDLTKHHHLVGGGWGLECVAERHGVATLVAHIVIVHTQQPSTLLAGSAWLRPAGLATPLRTMLVLVAVSQATLDSGSCSRQASRMASDTWSHSCGEGRAGAGRRERRLGAAAGQALDAGLLRLLGACRGGRVCAAPACRRLGRPLPGAKRAGLGCRLAIQIWRLPLLPRYQFETGAANKQRECRTLSGWPSLTDSAGRERWHGVHPIRSAA